VQPQKAQKDGCSAGYERGDPGRLEARMYVLERLVDGWMPGAVVAGAEKQSRILQDGGKDRIDDRQGDADTNRSVQKWPARGQYEIAEGILRAKERLQIGRAQKRGR